MLLSNCPTFKHPVILFKKSHLLIPSWQNTANHVYFTKSAFGADCGIYLTDSVFAQSTVKIMKNALLAQTTVREVDNVWLASSRVYVAKSSLGTFGSCDFAAALLVK